MNHNTSNEFLIRDWSIDHLNTLIQKLGGNEIANLIRTGEIGIKHALFNKSGYRISMVQSQVTSNNGKYQISQPELNTEEDFAKRISSLHDSLNINTGITAKQLKNATEYLLNIIRKNFLIADIANGVYLPVILPQLMADNLGTELNMYLDGVCNSYIKTFNAFNDRDFINILHKDKLVDAVSIVNGSQHDRLINKMKKGPVPGLYFPNSLQGFSANACCEQMSELPDGFILSGMDTPIAIMMYPDVLAYHKHTPNLCLAALQWRSFGFSFIFRLINNELFFDDVSMLSHAENHHTNGLLFIG